MPQGRPTSTVRLLALLGLGCSLGAALPDVPTPDNFLRRVWAKATVLGDYVYIDGGELNQLVDGKLLSGDSNVVNSTLSIDIATSWNSSAVAIRTIPKPGPAKSDVGLWTDTAAGTFYSWGGRWPGGKNITKNALWKFTADGKGGGTWAVEAPANPTLFNGLHQTEYGAFVNTDSTGFVIGGVSHFWTELDHNTADPIPGMVAFDMKSKIWQNGTINFSPYDMGTLNQATALHLPSIGADGLIIVLGGYAPPTTSDLNQSDGPPLDLGNLTMFNPQTKQKYWQRATGTIPPTPRGQACTVVFPTSDGGYDIFLFGGVDGRHKFNHEDAYILSLPGFIWTKLPNPPGGPRSGHTCVRVGKRQVLSIGGADSSRTDADKAPQGLLLFDMTTMEWKDSYDASAADCERAPSIQSWYSNGSLDTVDWSTDEVQKLFAAAAASATTSDSTPSPTGNTATTSTTNPSTSSSSTPVGAIVGGVMGGIAAVAVIVAASWVLVRRHRKQQQQQQDITAPTAPNGTPPTGTSTFTGATVSGPLPDGYMHGYYGPPPEMEAKDQQDDDDKGPGIHEIGPGGHGYPELPGGRAVAEVEGGTPTTYPYSYPSGYPYSGGDGGVVGFGDVGVGQFGEFGGSSPPAELDPNGRPVELEQGRYYARPAELDGTPATTSAASATWR